ncbi:hypothetical protein EC988_006276, partial [Linderina pennispora]
MPSQSLREKPLHLAFHELVVENDNSMARDQFAAERNFLSWIKLAMVMVASSAMTMTKFQQHITRFTQFADGVSVYIIVLAMLIVVVSTLHVVDSQGRLAILRRPMRVFRPVFVQVVGSMSAASLIFVLA